jgi:EAL domain-containing protein (putative c-di-GMP-specific phosphodiesterase class I)
MNARHLLLIDDEPAFGRFIAHAAETGGFKAHVTLSAEPFMANIASSGRRLSRSISECRRWTGSSCCASCGGEVHRAVIIISGFDRRVLDSSMRLGSALGLNMVGPLEKPSASGGPGSPRRNPPVERRMTPLSEEESRLAAALQLAIDREELALVYQPKLMLESGCVAAVEALSRWTLDGEAVEPTRFIPLAERSGSIDKLTEWVLRTALKQWISWRDQGATIGIAVNVSAVTLRNLDFPDLLQRLCHVEGVPPEQITVELTEGATQHVIRLLDTLTRFRIKGVGVALDDFGTGYSSLLQLRQLPFTELKIDQHFIHDLTVADDSRLIAKSVIDLAHGLGLKAVAEGVEDAETLKLLAALGCDEVQGYFVARPMPGPELVPWMLASATSWQDICGERRAS